MYFILETHSFFPLCATLEDIRNFLMLCTAFTQAFSGKCRNYRLRVIQTLIPRGSAGSNGSVGQRARINVASRQIGRRFESGRRVFNFTMEWVLNFTSLLLRMLEGISSFLSREKDATLFTFDISLYAIPFRQKFQTFFV